MKLRRIRNFFHFQTEKWKNWGIIQEIEYSLPIKKKRVKR